IIAKNKTTFVGGEGNKDLITERTEMLRSQEKLSKSKWDKEKMQKRIGKMTGGVAVLRIGAATETEMKEKKARVDDALNATRAAMAEGVVVGGGVALLRARDALSKLMETSSGDRSIGVQAVYDALSAPLRQISENAGEEPSVVVSKVLENKSESFGYNARNKEYVDLLKEGVIDPVKVTRNALQSAGSIAG
ncbi:MAG: TCP-1/cpn60 chaperonin family protein, partial [Candidatus Thermoplasmatota archaeon]|nr:TCP-1/cpn60 chaperonin family protein [Candidatus Thermoplasmatota archaeon]